MTAIPSPAPPIATITVCGRVIALGPTTNTKRQIVEMAFEEVALSGYEFDLTPEEMFSCLRSLDAAMAQDQGESIRLAYNFPDTFGQGDLDEPSGIPDCAVEYASLRLAKVRCSRMGKTLSAEASSRLSAAKAAARALTAVIPNSVYGYGTIAGAGNRRWGLRGDPFLRDYRDRCE